MSEQATFISACLSGDTLVTDVDDWVDRWHDANGAPYGQPQSLPQFLGMAEEEYALWVERPESLRFILAARKASTSVSAAGVEEIAGLAAAAARATNDAEAAGVIAWLRKTGRLV
jgi:hypothetical protein